MHADSSPSEEWCCLARRCRTSLHTSTNKHGLIVLLGTNPPSPKTSGEGARQGAWHAKHAKHATTMQLVLHSQWS